MLPVDVIHIITAYAREYHFKDWIDETRIHWRFLSSNPNAIGVLEKNLHRVYWHELSGILML